MWVNQQPWESLDTLLFQRTFVKCSEACFSSFVSSEESERLGDELALQRMKSLSESQRALELERKLFSSERTLRQVTSAVDHSGSTALENTFSSSQNSVSGSERQDKNAATN